MRRPTNDASPVEGTSCKLVDIVAQNVEICRLGITANVPCDLPILDLENEDLDIVEIQAIVIK